MQPLTDTILQCYNDFRQDNDKRIETFFIQLRADCFKLYTKEMQSVLDATKPYYEETDLQKLHRNAENKAMAAMVCLISKKKINFSIYLFHIVSEKMW